jgi:thiamine biosynthesis lipoprotein
MMYLDKKRYIPLKYIRSSLWLLFLFINACQPDLPEYTWRGNTMGTTYQVKVTGVDLEESLYKKLHEKMTSALIEVNRQMSTYDPESEISLFNSFKSTAPYRVSADFVDVLRTAIEVFQKSNGSFDITVGPLVELWGFGAAERRQLPSDQEIQKIMSYVGSQNLQVISDSIIKKDIPELRIDLSAIAKGYGVDVLAKILSQQKFDNFLVEIGGEVVTQGINAKRELWKVGIDRPDFANLPGHNIVRVLGISNVAVATSGDYRNYFEFDGKIYSHTINPATGKPVRHKLASVTVIAQDCMMADALATAVMVMGPVEGLKFVENLPGVEAMLIERDDQETFTEHQTSGFGRYISERR